MSEGANRRLPGRLYEGAHRVNRNPKLVEVARRARERALGGDHHVDLLSTARGRPSDLAARQLVTLRGDAPGILGELGLTALQTWQRLAESQDRGHGKVDVAILFTDLVGFSSWALEAGDRGALRLLRKVTEAIEPAIAERRGEVVKRLGDGVMAAFWDAPSAVEAAFAANERVASIEVAGYRPRLHTGIHLGRPRKLGGDYFGVDVNIAARLTEAARPGEILVSDRTLEKLPADAARAKKRRFSAKGAPKDLSAFAVRPPESAGRDPLGS
jgi:adenylate cyclase